MYLFFSFIDSKGPQWKILRKFQNLDFTSVAIGASAGFISCLVMMTCPRLLKRYCQPLLRMSDVYTVLNSNRLYMKNVAEIIERITDEGFQLKTSVVCSTILAIYRLSNALPIPV